MEIRELAKAGSPDPTNPEHQAEHQSRDEADTAGNELLRLDDERGECGRHDQADRHSKDRGPRQIGVRQDHRKRGETQEGYPDDRFSPDPVSHRDRTRTRLNSSHQSAYRMPSFP